MRHETRRKTIILLALAALCASCGITDTAAEQQRAPMRNSVAATWRGQDLAVLLQHPMFGQRQPHVVQLENGVESWVYSTCWSDAHGTWVQVNQQMLLANPGAYQNCCHSQFFVAPAPGGRKQILEYRPNGCNTNCTAAAFGCGNAQPGQGQLNL